MWPWPGKKKRRLELNVLSLPQALEAILEATTELLELGPKAVQSMKHLARQSVYDWPLLGQKLNLIMAQDQAAYGIYLLKETELLESLLPELAQNRALIQGGLHHLDVLDHSLETLRQLLVFKPEASLALRWACLLHDCGKAASYARDDFGQISFLGHDKLGESLSKQLLTRLQIAETEQAYIAKLVRYHMLPLAKNSKEAERFVRKRQALLPDLLYLMIADREAARGPLASAASRRAYRIAIARVINALEPPKIPNPPLLRGDEVMSLLHISPGPLIAKALKFLEHAEAAGDIKTKEEAEKALLHYAKHQGWLVT